MNMNAESNFVLKWTCKQGYLCCPICQWANENTSVQNYPISWCACVEDSSLICLVISCPVYFAHMLIQLIINKACQCQLHETVSCARLILLRAFLLTTDKPKKWSLSNCCLVFLVTLWSGKSVYKSLQICRRDLVCRQIATCPFWQIYSQHAWAKSTSWELVGNQYF